MKSARKKPEAGSPGAPPPALPMAAMQIEMWPIGRPIPYPKNARKWSARAIATVASSIREYGFRQPIVVDDKDVIVIGHLRLAGAKSIDLQEVPVHVARDLTPAQIKGLRLADNRSHEEAFWDWDLLGPELGELKELGFDLKLTAFTKEEAQKAFLSNWDDSMEPEAEKPDAGYKEQYGVIVICENELQQAEVFDKLTVDGYACKIVVT